MRRVKSFNTTTPMAIAGEYLTTRLDVREIVRLTLIVSANVAGTLEVYSGDGTGGLLIADCVKTSSIAVVANVPQGLSLNCFSDYSFVKYVNGGVIQATFTLAGYFNYE